MLSSVDSIIITHHVNLEKKVAKNSVTSQTSQMGQMFTLCNTLTSSNIVKNDVSKKYWHENFTSHTLYINKPVLGLFSAPALLV